MPWTPKGLGISGRWTVVERKPAARALLRTL